MTLQFAMALAQSIVSQLSPVVDKIAVAGSIRRKSPECGDVEVLVIPKSEPEHDMFGHPIGKKRSQAFINLVNSWEKVKGDPNGKYTQRIVKGEKVDIFIAEERNWGNTMIIRTGNSDFSHMLMTRVNKWGYEQKDGYLWRDGVIVPVYEEKEYFRLLDLPYIEPENRNKDAFINYEKATKQANAFR